MSSAFELAQQGAKVTVLERGECGSESSWAGGGILSPLMPWDYPAAVTDLTQLSCRLFPQWVKQVAEISGIDPEYRRSGMLVLPKFDEGQAVDWCRGKQVRIEPVRGRDVLPELGCDCAALWLPDVAQVRNPRLIKALRLALERMGVRIEEHVAASGIEREGERIGRLNTTAGYFAAEHYIFAAGAWSKEPLGEYAARLDIKPIRGQMLLFKAQPGMLRQIVVQNGLYLIPRDDGHVLVGSTLEDAGFDKSTTEEAGNELHSRALKLLPFLEKADLVQHWAGLRPGSPGNIPTIARHHQLENLYLNSGHFRYGVTMAPASAHILTNLVFGYDQPCVVSPYDWPQG